MDKKLTQLRDCFSNEGCKLGKGDCGRCTQFWHNEKVADAEVLNQQANQQDHQPLTCAPENCWECSNVLC